MKTELKWKPRDIIYLGIVCAVLIFLRWWAALIVFLVWLVLGPPILAFALLLAGLLLYPVGRILSRSTLERLLQFAAYLIAGLFLVGLWIFFSGTWR